MSRRSGVACPRLAGIRTRQSAYTATPIGRLTRKIQCQLSASVSRPPSNTPMLPPPAMTKPKMPIAFARSAGSVNKFMIRAIATAETTEPPAEEQEAAEGKHVGVHDPDERGLGEAQIRADRGQRDVHDRRVEDDHQVPEAEDDKREPALPDVDAACHDYFSFILYFFFARSFSISRKRSTASLGPKSSSSKNWRTSISPSLPSIEGLGKRLAHSIASSRDFTWMI